MVKSMAILGRPLTSSVRDWIMQRRGSEGSEAVGPVDMPRDAFHLARDSSSASTRKYISRLKHACYLPQTRPRARYGFAESSADGKTA